MHEISYHKKRKVLNRAIVVLGLVSLFADISSEMLYPITPLFLTSILGASMAQVGIIEGVAEAIASLLKTYSGFISDRSQHRKPWIIAGYFFSAISKPFVGLSTNWLQVLGARSFDRFGKGIRSAPRDALLAESVDPVFHGAAFGWHRAMDTLGAAIGPLLTLFLLSSLLFSMRSLFLWAVVPGLIAVALLFFVPEKKSKKAEVAIQKILKLSSLRQDFKKFSAKFKIYLGAWGIFSLTNSSDVFLILKAKSLGTTLTQVILMYCFYNLFYALLSPVLGEWSDRLCAKGLSRKIILQGGLILFAMVYAGFAVVNQAWQLWVLFAFYGIYMAATDGVGKAYAVDLIPKNAKGTGLGLLGTVTGLATVMASFVAGELWDHFGAKTPFYYGAMGAVLAVLLLSFFKECSPVED